MSEYLMKNMAAILKIGFAALVTMLLLSSSLRFGFAGGMLLTAIVIYMSLIAFGILRNTPTKYSGKNVGAGRATALVVVSWFSTIIFDSDAFFVLEVFSQLTLILILLGRGGFDKELDKLDSLFDKAKTYLESALKRPVIKLS